MSGCFHRPRDTCRIVCCCHSWCGPSGSVKPIPHQYKWVHAMTYMYPKHELIMNHCKKKGIQQGGHLPTSNLVKSQLNLDIEYRFYCNLLFVFDEASVGPYWWWDVVDAACFVTTHVCRAAAPRLRTSPDVQRRVCAGEPPLGRGIQAAPRGELWHLSKPEQEAEAKPKKTGHWYGESQVHSPSVLPSLFFFPSFLLFLHPSIPLDCSVMKKATF